MSLARTTVTTILSRLYGKGSVDRVRSGRGSAYIPTEDAPGPTARRMHAGLAKDDDRGAVLARSVSPLDDADERLPRSLLDRCEGRGKKALAPGNGCSEPCREPYSATPSAPSLNHLYRLSQLQSVARHGGGDRGFLSRRPASGIGGVPPVLVCGAP
ncbi:BlaI/MecI/CopY family transcriptional regulator [Streptomyces sp. NPDC006923]|uniref:BlaI/MecI/CopY family transcriptional regulator n=1 Tax=Streptomyces sp. NPDC006923 TaxID=3155355 RepID=UPI0033E3A1A7